jgi:hypothetical protein
VDTLALLEAFRLFIPEELAKGNIVELGEFGPFRLTVLASGEDHPEDVSKRNIKKVKVRFKPEIYSNRFWLPSSHSWLLKP